MSRRNEIAMTDAEIDDYLASQLTMIIISNGHNGFPHPMPMHFCVHADRTVAMTTYKKSQKVANFMRDPRASLLVESGEDYAQLRSLIVYAQTEVIDDVDRTLQCMSDCRNHSNAIRGALPTAAEDAEFMTAAATRARKRLVLKFHPESYVSWDHAKLGGVY